MFGRTAVHLLFRLMGARSKLFVYIASGAEVILSACIAFALMTTVDNDWFVRFGVGLSVWLYCFRAIIQFLVQKQVYERSLAPADIDSSNAVLSMSGALRQDATTITAGSDAPAPAPEQAWYESKLVQRISLIAIPVPFVVGMIIMRAME
ncbi:MAG TPA: hypothetical protein VFE84_08785 [Patescibacteria group bacterium]|nr:hypothetical protein [Patescibacteria group bacterium]